MGKAADGGAIYLGKHGEGGIRMARAHVRSARKLGCPRTSPAPPSDASEGVQGAIAWTGCYTGFTLSVNVNRARPVFLKDLERSRTRHGMTLPTQTGHAWDCGACPIVWSGDDCFLCVFGENGSILEFQVRDRVLPESRRLRAAQQSCQDTTSHLLNTSQLQSSRHASCRHQPACHDQRKRHLARQGPAFAT